jgi:biopolymer transport protein ExbD
VVRGVAIAIVSVLGACRGSSHRSDADRAAALRSCGDAFGEIGAMAPSQLSDVTAIYARGCHDLYSEPACRRAVARLADISPDSRLATLVGECSAAYCDKLDEPKPRVCKPGAKPEAVDLGPAWRELDQRILELELGSKGPEIARVAGVITHEVTAVAVDLPRAAAADVATDRIALSVAGDRVTVAIAGRTWKVGRAPTPAELAPIVAAIDRSHQVVIEASKDLQYATVVAVLDALRSAGVTKVSLATRAH